MIDEKMTKECPERIIDALAQFDAQAIRDAYDELYSQGEGTTSLQMMITLDVSQYIPTMTVRRCVLQLDMTCNEMSVLFASTGDFGTGRKVMPFEVAQKAIIL